MMNRLNIDFKSLLPIVREFFKALGQGRTYSIRRNWYVLFGILWGMPIPVVTIGIDLYSSGLGITIPNITKIIISHPLHLFFLMHPIFFGVVFGAMGTIRFNKEQRIHELDRIKSNFLSMVSHELRTPLTTIQGYITFLLTEKTGALTRAQKEALEISEGMADLLNHLIEELLDLSKIESGEFKVRLAGVNMTEVMDEAAVSLRLFADEQGIILENRLPRGLPLVLADRERIVQVATNLIRNAIKFNRKCGRVEIGASCDGQNKKIIFCVADTGIGIPEDRLDKIFDKFYQVDSSEKRRYGGCGLGLAIAKSILKLHRGRIWAESKIGQGSKFFFELNLKT